MESTSPRLQVEAAGRGTGSEPASRRALFVERIAPEKLADAGSGWQRLLLPPIAVFLLTRLFLLVIASRATRLIADPHISGNGSVLPSNDILAHAAGWTAPWFRFDAYWYSGIAVGGYHWGSLGRANTNFMPLYPGLVHVLTPLALGSVWLAAWLLANIAFLAALILIWWWALQRGSETAAMRTVVLCAVFPFSLFLAAPYAESLFLALAAGAFLLAERGHWRAAAVLAGLATITRPVGFALVLGLFVMALTRGKRREAALSLVGLVPLCLFSGYLALRFGHPLAFLTYHSAGWQPVRGDIAATIGAQFQTALSPFDRVDAAIAGIFLLSAALAWRRLGAGYAVYVAAGVLLPLAHGLVSMERYVCVLYPAMASWATFENRALQGVLFATSLLGMIVATTLFAAGYSIF